METSPPRRAQATLALPAILMISYGVGFVGSIAVNSGIDYWYIILNKPSWSVPNWVFAPMSTVSYGIVGWSAYKVWSIPTGSAAVGDRKRALIALGVSLLLSGAWPWLFFAGHLLLFGFIEGCLLVLSLVASLLLCSRLNRGVVSLLATYLAWSVYVVALSCGIWLRNR